MSIDLGQAVKRLRAGPLDGTLSGAEILDSAFNFVEMYHFTFMDTLKVLGVVSDDDLKGLLVRAISVQHVGDVTGFDSPDLALTCVMGLVLLDRIAQTGWGKSDFEQCFYFHEQMFECFEIVCDTKKRKNQARAAANARAQKSNEARLWVWGEWECNKADYNNNKSDFARTYVGFVRGKFLNNKSDPLLITVKTISEVWLKGPPTASKKAV